MIQSMTPAVVKLPKVGDTLTLAVMSCLPSTQGQYPEVEFTGLDPQQHYVTIKVPKPSVDRQFQRCEIESCAHAVGKILTFSRSPNTKQPTKPFWDISKDGDVDEPTKAAMAKVTPAATTESASRPAAASTAEQREKLSASYKKITQFVLSDIAPIYREANVPPDATNISAMVHTLFIAATRNGS